MSIVISEGSAPIPEDLAVEFGLQDGAVAEWKRTEDGRLALSPAHRPKGASHRLRGLLKPYLQTGESGVGSFLQWREEDAHLDGSQ